MLLLQPTTNDVYLGATHWEGWRRGWRAVREVPDGLQHVSPRDAVAAIQSADPHRGLPIGIIGPKVADKGLLAIAEHLGAEVAAMKVALFCGGKSGVMEAACKGAKSCGGLTIGLLPDDDWAPANPYVDVPLASGIGPARNAIIARACPVLIAVGGEYGTLSEMAFGLHFGRAVISLGGAPEVKGARIVETVDEAIDLAATFYLGISETYC